MVKNLFLFFTITTLFISCTNKPNLEQKSAFVGMNEGVIEYDITYPKELEKDFIMRLMPKKLIVKFKGDYVSSESDMAAKQIRAKFVTNSLEKSMNMGITYGVKKYGLKLKGKDTKLSTHNFDSYTKFETNKVITLLGFNCKIAKLVSVKDSFEVYYTQELGIPKMHWADKMSEIEGFPLKFRMILKGINATITAKKIYGMEIPDSEFVIDSTYIISTKEKVNSIFPLYD